MTCNFVKMMTYAARLNMIVIMTITFGSFGIAQIKQSYAASVKNIAVIEEDVIRAQDLFEGLSRKSETVIGPSPRPGHDMVINARTLLRIAVALDLPWRPKSGREQIIVRRSATIIDPDLIEAEIINSLYDTGVTGNFRLVFNDIRPSITLPKNESNTVHIGSLDYDPAGGYFTAELVAPSKERPLKTNIVSGKVEKMIDVPVLEKTYQKGQMIKAQDINWISIPAYKVQENYIIDSNMLVGYTPRRMAIAGEPLRQNEIIEPLMVKRGDRVSISYQAGPIQLVSEGKALENGSKGDVIRVVNYSSNRTIDAEIKNTASVVVN